LKKFDINFTKKTFDAAKQHEFVYFETSLNAETVAVLKSASNDEKKFDAVCVFVNDVVNESVLLALKELGVRLIACRSAGFDHVDMYDFIYIIIIISLFG
jgi:D-lactate dehydrogenase